MPTYDYECTACGHEFEHFQAMSDDPLSTCPECGGKLRRLIGGGSGIIFKGSGFYVTDNGKAKKGVAAQSEKKEDGSTAKSGKSGEGSSSSTKESSTSDSKKDGKTVEV